MEILFAILPSLIAVVLTFLIIIIINKVMGEKFTVTKGRAMVKRVIVLTVAILGVFIFVVLLPMEASAKEQVLKLIGLIFTALIAFASTTFFSNLVAGIMIKLIKGYKIGDFIKVNEHFGKVTELDLLHTEIQTIERDLVTFPNYFIIQTPVTTLRNSGTIISSTVSLGYDESRNKIQAAMLKAAKKAGLENPFVSVIELGDFSVTYRVNGLLKELDALIFVRSQLNCEVMDAIHEAGIEIVSPNFQNIRTYNTRSQFIPESEEKKKKHSDSKPDEMLFDKALKAEVMEKLKLTFDQYASEIKKLLEVLKKSKEEKEKKSLDIQIKKLELRKERVKLEIERRESDSRKE